MHRITTRAHLFILICMIVLLAITARVTQGANFQLAITIPNAHGTLSGTVTAQESNMPLSSGIVTIAGKQAEIINGDFSFSKLPTGEHEVSIDGPFRELYQTKISIDSRVNQAQFTIKSEFSQEEIDMLARIARAEAEGETTIGKQAVAATVLNRVLSDRYPNSISSVIYQRVNGRYQYSPVADGRIRLAPQKADYQAAYQALAGSDPSYGATGFFNAAKTRDSWVRSHPVTTIIGGHTFFYY